MKKISVILTLCVIFNFFSSQNLMAQRNKKGNEAAVAGAAVLGGLIATKIAIEEIKEQLESDAVTHIISNYPEINEFRLKCLFENGKKWSDQSETDVLTFQLTLLNKARKTLNRKILLRFNNNNFINEYGVKESKVEYLLLEKDEWNSMLAFFVNLAAVGDSVKPTKIDDKKLDYLVPLYKTSNCENSEIIRAMKYNIMGEESYICYKETEYYEYLSNLQLKINRLALPLNSYNTYEYPFHRLKGDDYIVGNFSSRFKIFFNEKTMGLFLIWMDKTILLSRNIIGEIHSFLNFQDIQSKENMSSQNTVDSTEKINKKPGFYYNDVLCHIIEEISETEVKIKYLTETGRAYYKKIVNRSDIEEVK